MKLVRLVLIVVGCVALLPAIASAQSAITGQVTDNTGGVLPGVTVEARSPVLIEQVRTAVSDGQGRYTIVDVRPGIYSVTFTLAGFRTVLREGLEVPANFTQTVDATLAVGGIEETITVSGASPVVDVQSAARTEVVARGFIDSLPTPRNTQSYGYLAQGVRLTKPDVGGAQMMEQVQMLSHGANSNHSTMQVDGMMVNAAIGDGRIMNYNNQALIAEMAISTAANPAEVQAGGLRLNMIPKDGGNTISGSVYAGVSDGSWQANNVTDALRRKGLSTPSGISNIHDVNPSIGGPIFRDKLWYFVSARAISVDEKVVDAPPLPDGSPALVEQYVRSGLVRLTTQVTPRNKVSAYLDRIFKFKGREFVFGVEPLKASRHRDPGHGNYHTFQAKWTSTISTRALLEVGYSQVYERLLLGYQPGVKESQPSDLRICEFTPCYHPLSYDQTRPWFAKTTSIDFITNQTTEAASFGEINLAPTDRFYPNAAFSYVTGSHNFKVGMQWSFGPDNLGYDGNGHLHRRYRNGVPEQVVALNMPVQSVGYVTADRGIYAQDSWTIDRFTVNAGVRFDQFRHRNNETRLPAGRFVRARNIPEEQIRPSFNDISPRVSLAYDLFGDARTALKFSVNKFVRPYVSGIARRYHKAGLAQDTRDWFDCHLDPAQTTRCSGLNPYGTNGDNIAQDHEIGPVNNIAQFAERTAGRRPDPDLQREYNIEYTASVQHEILPRVSVTLAYYRRTFYDLEAQDNVLVQPSDYIPFTAISPLDGQPFTLYNLDTAKRGIRDIVDTNSDTNRQFYNGIELSVQGRLPNGAAVSAGWTGQRYVQNTCDAENPNGEPGQPDFLDWNRLVVAGGRFCDQTVLGIPFRHDYKVFGVYPLPWDVEASGSLQSYAGVMRSVNWVVPLSAFPGGQRTLATTVDLLQPGTDFLRRWNQVDIAIRKLFRFGRYESAVQADIYNLNNSSIVLTEIEAFGSSLGRPQTILQGRLLRLAFQMKW
jgi:hypothetical protein